MTKTNIMDEFNDMNGDLLGADGVSYFSIDTIDSVLDMLNDKETEETEFENKMDITSKSLLAMILFYLNDSYGKVTPNLCRFALQSISDEFKYSCNHLGVSEDNDSILLEPSVIITRK